MFLAINPCCRHGRGHTFNPSQVNYRANVRALQLCGVTHILAATACGSLKEDIKPGDLVLVDSFIDRLLVIMLTESAMLLLVLLVCRTTKRDQTFHEMDSSTGGGFGTCCHIPMSPAFCLETRQALLKAAENNFASGVHFGGTVVAIEGPRFSSKAESRLYKSWGCDVINMTTVPEVRSSLIFSSSFHAFAFVGTTGRGKVLRDFSILLASEARSTASSIRTVPAPTGIRYWHATKEV